MSTRPCRRYIVTAAAQRGWSPIDNVSHRLRRPGESQVGWGRASALPLECPTDGEERWHGKRHRGCSERGSRGRYPRSTGSGAPTGRALGQADRLPDLFDNPRRLMADHQPRLGAQRSSNKCRVPPADRTGRSHATTSVGSSMVTSCISWTTTYPVSSQAAFNPRPLKVRRSQTEWVSHRGSQQCAERTSRSRPPTP